VWNLLLARGGLTAAAILTATNEVFSVFVETVVDSTALTAVKLAPERSRRS
jgi:hypothetical protein